MSRADAKGHRLRLDFAERLLHPCCSGAENNDIVASSAPSGLGDRPGKDDHGAMRHSVSLLPVEDYTNKYKGEQVEVALFGGEYQEGVLTAYCSFEDVPHVELNGHILIPLQNVASLHCSSRCDAPEPDWPPRGFIEDDTGES